MCLTSLFGLGILFNGGGILNASEVVSRQSERVITGIVKDANGEPVIGASVIQDKTSNGVITDIDGKFSLTVPEGSEIVIACLGYQDAVVKVGKMSHYAVVLQESAEFLEEVVVVGMNNRQTKRSITGAVSTIQTKELVQSPVANISNALAGKLPGLITVQSSGEPGADASALYIRGLGTYGSSAPLVVIDGLPRNKADFDMLDPNEIESITIL